MNALKATVAFHVQYNYRLNSFVFYIDPENSTDLDKIAKYAVKFDEIPPPYLKWFKIFMSVIQTAGVAESLKYWCGRL